jgi:hypothetical protein
LFYLVDYGLLHFLNPLIFSLLSGYSKFTPTLLHIYMYITGSSSMWNLCKYLTATTGGGFVLWIQKQVIFAFASNL